MVPAGQAHARLEDTPTVRRLLEALPITARANTWGEEIYFDTGVDAELGPDARQVVDPGTVCFWVEGKALAAGLKSTGRRMVVLILCSVHQQEHGLAELLTHRPTRIMRGKCNQSRSPAETRRTTHSQTYQKDLPERGEKR